MEFKEVRVGAKYVIGTSQISHKAAHNFKIGEVVKITYRYSGKAFGASSIRTGKNQIISAEDLVRKYEYVSSVRSENEYSPLISEEGFKRFKAAVKSKEVSAFDNAIRTKAGITESEHFDVIENFDLLSKLYR